MRVKRRNPTCVMPEIRMNSLSSMQGAKEKYPEARLRIISDNILQRQARFEAFVARDAGRFSRLPAVERIAGGEGQAVTGDAAKVSYRLDLVPVVSRYATSLF